MKVAICMSAHLRSWKITYPTLRSKIIDKFNADVFLDTWDTIDLKSCVKTESIKDIIQIALNTKKIHIEPFLNDKGIQYESIIGHDRHGLNGIGNLFYKISSADKMRREYEKENNFQYDIIFRLRPDILINNESEIQTTDLVNAKDNNLIYIPDFGHYAGINDQFAFGSNQTMTHYAECFDNFNNLNFVKTGGRPEAILLEHLLQKIDSSQFRFFNIEYILRRTDGSKVNCRKNSDGIPKMFNPEIPKVPHIIKTLY